MCSHFAARTKLSTLQLLLPAPYSLQCLLSQPRPFKPLLRAHTLAAPLSFRSSATLPFTPFLNLFLGLFIEQEALLMTLRHTMLPSPAEQRQLLIMSLERMPSADHEMFLGTMIYPLVQVRILSIPSPIVLSIRLSILYTLRLIPWKAHVQAVDPARAGKVTGMLLEQDVYEIIDLIVFPDTVR